MHHNLYIGKIDFFRFLTSFDGFIYLAMNIDYFVSFCHFLYVLPIPLCEGIFSRMSRVYACSRAGTELISLLSLCKELVAENEKGMGR